MHLNDTVLLQCWVQSILDITFPNHSKVTDDIDRCCPQHVMFNIRKRLRRSNND